MDTRFESYDFQTGLGKPLFRLPILFKYVIQLLGLALVVISVAAGYAYWRSGELNTKYSQVVQANEELEAKTLKNATELKSLELSARNKEYWIPILGARFTAANAMSSLLDAIPDKVVLTQYRMVQSYENPAKFSLLLFCSVIGKDRSEASDVLSKFRKSFSELSKSAVMDNTSSLVAQSAVEYKGQDARLFKFQEEWQIATPVLTADELFARYVDLDKTKPVSAERTNRMSAKTPTK